jgi:hypothetical protein
VNLKVKTNTAPKQTFVSLVILGVLAVISGGIFWVQFNFNPAVQPLSSALPAGDTGDTRVTAPPAPAEKPLISSASGQSPLTPLETFDDAIGNL